MFELVITDEFDDWLMALKDRIGRAKVIARLQRLERGNPGDHAPVGAGVMELRVHFGPGYRIHDKHTGRTIVVILCGGDKDSQPRDIDRAKRIAADI